MEITSTNFKSDVHRILSAINSADFICFDCEFSGLGKGGAIVSAYETPELLYYKHKSNVGDYLLLQVGLCTFRYVPEDNRYGYQAFSCYVFPRVPPKFRSLSRYCFPSRLDFTCQADCLEFLAGQNFDFNKWICQGVGYLRSEEVEALQKEILKRHEYRATSDNSQAPNIPDNIKGKINKILKRVQEFMQKIEDAREEGLELEGLTGLERKLVCQTLEHRYGQEIFVEFSPPNADNDVSLIIRKCLTTEEHQKLREAAKTDELELAEEAKGFCAVIAALRDWSRGKNKPLVGHNMVLDLMHLLKSFCADLPGNCADFKRKIREWFPLLVDTKLLAAQPPLRNVLPLNGSLGELLKRIRAYPFPKVTTEAESPEVGYSSEEGGGNCQLHDAGYDAYCTGLLFLGMACYYGDYKCPSRNVGSVPWDLILPFSNKIPCGRTQDLPFLNVAGEDATPSRSHVFHLEMPATWKTSDVTSLFSAYGQIHVNWLSSRAAFVTLHRKDQAELVMKLCQKTEEETEWSLRPVAEYLAKKEAELGLASSPPPTCSNSSSEAPAAAVPVPMGSTPSVECQKALSQLHVKRVRTGSGDGDGGASADPSADDADTEETSWRVVPGRSPRGKKAAKK